MKEGVEVGRWEMGSKREGMVTQKNIECIRVNYVYHASTPLCL